MSASRWAENIGWVALAVAGLVLVTLVVGTPFRVVAVAQSLTPFAVPILVVMAIAAAATGRSSLGFAAAVVGSVYLAALAPLVFAGSGPEAEAGSPQFTVVAANLLYENQRIDDIADALAELDADVLALSEVTPEIAEQLSAHPLADTYPYRVDRPAPLAGGLALWSRLPLGPIGDMPAFRRSIDTTALTGSGAVRMVLIHPPPPLFALDAWNDELDAIADVVAETTFPTVVLGDFNATYFHPPYRRMLDDAHLHDALVDVGRAFQPTWPTDRSFPPFTTLDHVLLDDELATLDADIAEMPGSDHHGVVVTIGFAVR